jgi:thioredoxin-related protein
MIPAFRSMLIVFLALLGAFPALTAEGTLPDSRQKLAQSALKETLELIVYERAGCEWCARWDREIAPIYPKTDIGKAIPLRRVNLDLKSQSDPVLEDPVRFTPTFVLLQNGKETGRIAGYHNDGFFWGMLESIAERLQKNPSRT